MNAGAAGAGLPLERCCIGARCAQKWWRICFGGRWGAWSIGDTKQQLCVVSSCSGARDCCVTGSCVGADAAVANLQREQCLLMGGRRRKSSASVSGATGVLATYGTLSRSLLVYHHEQMQANAVSQRAAWVLVPRPLNCRLRDAVSAHVAPRNGGASVSGAYGVHEASETLSGSFAQRHHARMLANAVSQRATCVQLLLALFWA